MCFIKVDKSNKFESDKVRKGSFDTLNILFPVQKASVDLGFCFQ